MILQRLSLSVNANPENRIEVHCSRWTARICSPTFSSSAAASASSACLFATSRQLWTRRARRTRRRKGAVDLRSLDSAGGFCNSSDDPDFTSRKGEGTKLYEIMSLVRVDVLTSDICARENTPLCLKEHHENFDSRVEFPDRHMS